jgi:hypothetical protein
MHTHRRTHASVKQKHGKWGIKVRENKHMQSKKHDTLGPKAARCERRTRRLLSAEGLDEPLIEITTGNFSCTFEGKSKERTLLITTIPRSRVPGRMAACLTNSVKVPNASIVTLPPSDSDMFAG